MISKKRSHSIWILVLSIGFLIFFCCQTGLAEQNPEDILYQANAFSILEAGTFDKVTTIKEMKNQGDMGVGGFEGMNGELIQLNGTIYQVTSDGTVSVPSDETGVTFMNTVKFNPKWTVDLSKPQNLTELEETLNKSFPSQDLIYAIRVDGIFPEMKVRSVPEQEEPYPPLSAVIANQSVFNLSDTTGTISGFWFPKWMQGTNYAGFHLHYLSADHDAGGHILDGAIRNGTAALDPVSTFQVKIR